jgi:hypothetical protein
MPFTSRFLSLGVPYASAMAAAAAPSCVCTSFSALPPVAAIVSMTSATTDLQAQGNTGQDSSDQGPCWCADSTHTIGWHAHTHTRMQQMPAYGRDGRQYSCPTQDWTCSWSSRLKAHSRTSSSQWCSCERTTLITGISPPVVKYFIIELKQQDTHHTPAPQHPSTPTAHHAALSATVHEQPSLILSQHKYNL